MKSLYHVSRKPIAVDVFNLKQCSGHIECVDAFSSDEFKTHISVNYPDGISNHGIQYLYEPFLSSGPNKSFANNELTIEIVLEMVRMQLYKKAPSRFTSVFACESIDDCHNLIHNNFNGIGEIYRVECDSFYKVDMNLVKQWGSIVGLQIMANKYWSGISSQSPFWEFLLPCPVYVMDKIS